MKILLIEDDTRMADFVIRGLREAGHVVDHLISGKDGLFAAATEAYDILIIDRMLPGMDGINIVRMLRQTDNKAPIMFLTTLGETNNRVEGLEAGADDYLVKPFAFAELLARLNALFRRPPIVERKTVLKV
ncbi:MAG: response regulator, partial [Alphaproteobacteria bacterium]|nr:response regulator [Alphaproteobacteria bacterium]